MLMQFIQLNSLIKKDMMLTNTLEERDDHVVRAEVGGYIVILQITGRIKQHGSKK